MKVLHLNSYNDGGGSESVFNFTRKNKFVEKNYSGFISRGKNKNEDSDIYFRSWEINNKILGTINYIFSWYNYKNLRIFLDKNDVDIIHLHGIYASLSPSLLSAIKKFKKIKNIKVVQTIHDFHIICPNSSLYNFNKDVLCEKCIRKKFKYHIFFDNCDRRGKTYSIIKGLRSIVANNIIKHANIVDLYIAPSKFIREKLIDGEIEYNNIKIIPTPIRKIFKINDSPKKNIICNFGRFSNEKNLQFLIEAFTEWKRRRNNDYKLLLIGEGEKESELKQLAKNKLMIDEILFKEYLPYERLMDELKIAKYFSMTSKWYENAPMTILEAASLNLIPIVPDFGGMKESIEVVLKAGKTYIPNNIESWCNTMDLLEENYSEELKKIIDSKEIILREFGVDKYYENVTNLYKNLLNS
ncbi:MAG: glycosyltransferase [Bacteroidota bacterium]